MSFENPRQQETGERGYLNMSPNDCKSLSRALQLYYRKHGHEIDDELPTLPVVTQHFTKRAGNNSPAEVTWENQKLNVTLFEHFNDSLIEYAADLVSAQRLTYVVQIPAGFDIATELTTVSGLVAKFREEAAVIQLRDDLGSF